MVNAELLKFAEELAKLAPIGTFLTAAIALIIALRSISAQRDTARKRASLDMMAKFAFDKSNYDLQIKYAEAIIALKNAKIYREFKGTEEHILILMMTQSLEAIAIGIETRVLDEKVCFEFFADTLATGYYECARFFSHEPENDWSALRALAERWKPRLEKRNKVRTAG